MGKVMASIRLALGEAFRKRGRYVHAAPTCMDALMPRWQDAMERPRVFPDARVSKGLTQHQTRFTIP